MIEEVSGERSVSLLTPIQYAILSAIKVVNYACPYNVSRLLDDRFPGKFPLGSVYHNFASLSLAELIENYKLPDNLSWLDNKRRIYYKVTELGELSCKYTAELFSALLAFGEETKE